MYFTPTKVPKSHWLGVRDLNPHLLGQGEKDLAKNNKAKQIPSKRIIPSGRFKIF